MACAEKLENAQDFVKFASFVPPGSPTLRASMGGSSERFIPHWQTAGENLAREIFAPGSDPSAKQGGN